MIQTILFDLFNTLTNGLIDPEKEIIHEFELSIPYSEVEAAVYGVKFTEWVSYLDSISSALKLPAGESTHGRLRGIFDDDASREFILDGVPDMLKRLRSRGYKMGIVSNIANPAYDILARDRLKDLFGAVIYSFDYGICKPSPVLFNHALSGLKSSAEETLMAGDSLTADIEGAKTAGIRGVLVGNRGLVYEHPHLSSVLEIEGYLEGFA